MSSKRPLYLPSGVIVIVATGLKKQDWRVLEFGGVAKPGYSAVIDHWDSV